MVTQHWNYVSNLSILRSKGGGLKFKDEKNLRQETLAGTKLTSIMLKGWNLGFPGHWYSWWWRVWGWCYLMFSRQECLELLQRFSNLASPASVSLWSCVSCDPSKTLLFADGSAGSIMLWLSLAVMTGTWIQSVLLEDQSANHCAMEQCGPKFAENYKRQDLRKTNSLYLRSLLNKHNKSSIKSWAEKGTDPQWLAGKMSINKE